MIENIRKKNANKSFAEIIDIFVGVGYLNYSSMNS